PAPPEAAAVPPVSPTPEPGAAAAAPATAAGKKRRPGNAPARGKKLKNHLKNQQQKLAKEGAAPLKRAVQLLKSMKRAKVDETVEIHMALGIDTTQSDQMVRGAVSLPHGIGKSVRVVVFAQGDNVARAREAGADFAGADDLIERVQKENWLDFDVALASQDMM